MGLTFDEAVAIGRENLWKLSTKGFEKLGAGLYLSSIGDTHDASRMFLHDLVWQHEVRGRHVVMIPNRNVLLVSGSEEAEGLLKLAEMAEQVMEQPRMQTGMAFELHDSSWRPFVPPSQSPSHNLLRKLALRSTLRDNENQTALLNKIFLSQGRDIFVGNVLGIERTTDGSVYSVTTWADGVEALLPEADVVAFGYARGETRKVIGYARWEKMQEAAGELLHRTPDYPARFHVVAFPTTEQFAAMDLSQDRP
jgi:hypothetical protein